jgi:hypothetical protein
MSASELAVVVSGVVGVGGLGTASVAQWMTMRIDRRKALDERLDDLRNVVDEHARQMHQLAATSAEFASELLNGPDQNDEDIAETDARVERIFRRWSSELRGGVHAARPNIALIGVRAGPASALYQAATRIDTAFMLLAQTLDGAVAAHDELESASDPAALADAFSARLQTGVEDCYATIHEFLEAASVHVGVTRQS